MIILDTCALIFDALSAERVTEKARKAIEEGDTERCLFCCEISLWEIAMLMQKKRLIPGADTQTFLETMLQSRYIR